MSQQHRGGPPPGSLRLLKRKMMKKKNREEAAITVRGDAGAAAAQSATYADAEVRPTFCPPAAPREYSERKEAAVKVEHFTKEQLVFFCKRCERACIQLTSSSKCICGHYLKYHDPKRRNRPCTKPGCKCRCFFYIFHEGAFMLRCRCKHKATDHSPVPPYISRKPPRGRASPCTGFDSPWVCNCDHGWAEHEQRVVKRAMIRLPDGLVMPEATFAQMLKASADDFAQEQGADVEVRVLRGGGVK